MEWTVNLSTFFRFKWSSCLLFLSMTLFVLKNPISDNGSMTKLDFVGLYFFPSIANPGLNIREYLCPSRKSPFKVI